ncbi:MAG: DUF3168 domain-containing protein [Hyphomicrobiaceae bacterium]
MTSAALDLQRSLYQMLRNDGALLAALGGARIYDDVPQRAELPYVTFGQSVMRDWSTGSETGNEHVLTLHVWSRVPGRKRLHEIMDVLVERLHEQPLALQDHRVVNVRHEISDARRDTDGETYHGVVRFRVVTERL